MQAPPMDGERGGHVRIGAVVQVEQRPLGAFQQHTFPLGQDVLNDLLGGAGVGTELFGPALALGGHFSQVQGLPPVYLGDEGVLLLYDLFQAGLQGFPVQQVPDPDSGAASFVHVGRTDAAASGADGGGPAGFLFVVVQRHVVRHDDMGPFADEEPCRVDAARLQLVQLAEENVGVYDHPVADDALYAGPTDARWDQVQLKGALVVDDSMAGVVAPGIADYAVDVPSKVVDDLPLAFVAPLAANHGVCWHTCSLPHLKLLPELAVVYRAQSGAQNTPLPRKGAEAYAV